MDSRSLMKKALAVLIVGGSAVTPLPAQTMGSMGVVDDVPFRSSGNVIELLLANTSQLPTGLTTVAISDRPTWLQFDADLRTHDSMNRNDEGIVRFTFSVDPEAPVGGVGHVRFNTRTERGEQRVTVVAVRVAAPESNVLEQNFPNPFNPSTSIGFLLANPAGIELSVFDLIGRKVTTLAEGSYPAGAHRVTFDARGMPSGTYLCRLMIRDAKSTSVLRKQLTLVK